VVHASGTGGRDRGGRGHAKGEHGPGRGDPGQRGPGPPRRRSWSSWSRPGSQCR